MTNKKQIIIDGVDVSECECLKYDKIGCSVDDCYCLGNDCYYKQLARKTQENEQLQEENEKLRMELCNQCGEKDDYNIPCRTIRELDYGLQKQIEENDCYRKTLKKIERYCEEQNLKYDTTACMILDIINKAKEGK